MKCGTTAFWLVARLVAGTGVVAAVGCEDAATAPPLVAADAASDSVSDVLTATDAVAQTDAAAGSDVLPGTDVVAATDVVAETDAATGSDALADAEGPTSCVANKNFCFDGDVWGCSPAGKPTGLKTTCTDGKSCGVSAGVAVCLTPAADADSGSDAETGTDATVLAEVSGGTDATVLAEVSGETDAAVLAEISGGTDVEIGTDAQAETDAETVLDAATGTDAEIVLDGTTGTDAVAVTDAVVGTDAVVPDAVADSGATDVATGTDASGPTSCVANKNFCFDNDVWGCNGSGTPTSIKKVCTDSQICGISAGVATCLAAPADATDASSLADTDELDAGTANDSGSDPDATVSATDAATGTDASQPTCTPNKNFCVGKDIRSCSGQGKWGIVTKTCGEGEVCGIDGNAAVCIPGEYACVGDTCTCTPTEPDLCVKVVKPFTTLGYVLAVESRTDCYQNTTVTECAEFNACVDGQCTSSVKDTTSPYWYKACDLPQYLNHKTDLEADCRCLVNQAVVSGLDPCKRPNEVFLAGKSVGTGPHMAVLDNVTLEGGFVEPTSNTLYFAVAWSSSTNRKGAVFAVDLATGNRTVVSGEYAEGGTPQSAGSGQPLAWPTDLVQGAGTTAYTLNNVATAAPQIIAVDLSTGARTLVWEGGNGNFGQCPSGEGGGKVIQYTSTGFLRDSDGSFLLGYANPIADGRGIVRISADGSACTSVTGSGSPGGSIDKGTGADMSGFVQGFTSYNGKLWAMTTQPKALWSIDPATGDRVGAVLVGSAGGIGERRVLWDASRGFLWTSGLMNSVTVVAWDPVKDLLYDAFVSCGDGLPFANCWAGPIKINSLNYGGMYLHPTTGQLYFGQDNTAIVEVEPETGNSIIRSL